MENRKIQEIKEKIVNLSKEEDKKFEQKDLEVAKSLNLEILKWAEKINDRKIIASVHTKLANILFRQNEFREAFSYALKAYRIFSKQKDHFETTRVLMLIGIIYNNLGNYLKSIKILRRTTVCFLKLKKIKRASRSYNWLGIAYVESSDEKKAMKYYFKGLSLAEKANAEVDIAYIKNSIGLAYWHCGNADLAIKYFHDALQIQKKNNVLDGIADILNNIGMVYHSNDKFDEAIQYFQDSLQNRNKIARYQLKSGNTQLNLGNVYNDLKKFEDAEYHIKKAMEIYKKVDNVRSLLFAIQGLSRIYLKQNKLSQAEEMIKLAKAKIKDHNFKELQELIFLDSAELYIKQKKYLKATECYKNVIQLREKFFNEKLNSELAKLQGNYEIQKRNRIAKFYKKKNIELTEANRIISYQNDQMKLINSILRHDVLNDLAVINSALKLYKTNQKAKYLDEIKNKIDNSSLLIKQLSVKEKKIDKNLQKIYLVTIFQKIKKDHPTVKIFGDQELKVLADKKISSVFGNLITNAKRHGKTNNVQITSKDQTNSVKILITNFGKQIPPEIQDKIFDKNFSFGASANTGLGLFIVKNILESYGGNITLQKSDSESTEFIITLRSG